MSYSRRRQNAEGRRGKPTDSIAAFIMRDRASTDVVSNETGEGVHPSSTSTDSEMLIADAVDKDCDSDTRATNLYIQRSNANSEKGLGGVDRFIERNQDIMASTSEWRDSERVLRSQEATQATTSSCQQHTDEEHRYASLEEIEIELIEQRCREQKMILEDEIVKHKERHKQAIEQLKTEEKYKEGYGYAADWWGVRPGSDYQPTECGDDGGR
jgi:hypothetical protein